MGRLVIIQSAIWTFCTNNWINSKSCIWNIGQKPLSEHRSGDAKQTNTLAGIQGGGDVSVTVGGNTNLIAGQIASTGGGTTSLTTGTLTSGDLSDYNNSSSFNFGLSGIDRLLGLTPKDDIQSAQFGSLTIGQSTTTKEGLTFSVVGEGKITFTDPAADQTITATLKRDLDNRQIVTIEESSGFQLEIPLIDFQLMAQQATNLANFMRALSAPLPSNVANMGPEAEAIFRRMIASGVSVEEATARAANPTFNRLANGLKTLEKKYGGIENAPKDFLQALLMMDAELLIAPDGSIDIRIPCIATGTDCRFKSGPEFERFKKEFYSTSKFGTYLEQIAAGLDPTGLSVGERAELGENINQLIACTALYQPDQFVELIGGATGIPFDKLVTFAGSSTLGLNWKPQTLSLFASLVESGSLPTGPNGLTMLNDIDSQLGAEQNGAALLTVGGIAIGFVPVLGDGVGAYNLIQAIRAGSVTSIFIEGIGLIPVAGDIGRAILKSADEAVAAGRAVLRADEVLAIAQCFVAGTPVWTQDGLKPIEAIRVGDRVLSRDAARGQTVFRPVTALFTRTASQIVRLTIEAADGRIETLGTTPGHPFYVPERGFVAAADLRPGMLLSPATMPSDVIAQGAQARFLRTAARDNDTAGFLRVKATSLDDRAQQVHNFEVAETHTYFVGDSGAWVHNACGPTLGKYLTSNTKALAEDIATKGHDALQTAQEFVSGGTLSAQSLKGVSVAELQFAIDAAKSGKKVTILAGDKNPGVDFLIDGKLFELATVTKNDRGTLLSSIGEKLISNSRLDKGSSILIDGRQASLSKKTTLDILKTIKSSDAFKANSTDITVYTKQGAVRLFATGGIE
jgi:Pretoxin HINT domain